MQFTAKPATTILVYNYRADLSKPVRKDGTPQPWLEDGRQHSRQEFRRGYGRMPGEQQGPLE